jgi:hypothetical protein
MTEWVLNIEESSKLAVKNIFVLERDGRKLFVKTVLSKDKTMLELVPLSRTELATLGIEVEESYSHTNLFTLDIEESESEPKKRVFNLNDPSDVAEAEAIARKQLAKLQSEGKLPESEKSEDLEAENEDLRAKLEIIATKEFERKKSSLGCNDPDIQNPEQLLAWQKGKIQSEPTRTPSGTMPLSKEQITGSSGKEGFDTEQEMIADLKKREANGDVNAKRILSLLYVKMARGLRQKGIEWEIPEDAQPSLKEITKNKNPNREFVHNEGEQA